MWIDISDVDMKLRQARCKRGKSDSYQYPKCSFSLRNGLEMGSAHLGPKIVPKLKIQNNPQ